MNEIHFRVLALGDGGYLAHAIGVDIFTEADKLSELQDRVREAVRCHFDEAAEPARVHLHFESAARGEDCSEAD